MEEEMELYDFFYWIWGTKAGKLEKQLGGNKNGNGRRNTSRKK